MAYPTWRDTAVPDLTGVQNSINAATRMFGGAATGLGEGLAGFDKAQSDGANQQALLASLRYSDPAKYQEALASGILTEGIDPKRLSVNTLNTLGNRSGTLLTNAATSQQNIESLYNYDRKVGNNEAIDAVRPQINASLTKATGIDMTPYANLTGDAQLKLGTDLYGATNTRITNDRVTRDDEVKQKAFGLIQEAQQNAGGPDAMRAFLGNIKDPAVATAVQNALGGNYGTLFGPKADTDPNTPMPAAADLFSAEGAGTRKGRQEDVVLGYGEFGLPNKPVSQSTLGELGEFGRNVLIKNTMNNEKLGLAGTGKGSSAVGKYQFTQETVARLAPTVFGKDWQNTVFTAENQDKLAEALFNETKGGNLKKIWQGLPNTGVGAYKDVPWSEMKDIIGKVESKVDPRDTSPAATITSSAATKLINMAAAESKVRIQSNDPTGVNRAVVAADKDKSSDNAVAAALVGKGGSIEGEDAGLVLEQIQKVMKKAGIEAGPAGAVVARNLKNRTWGTYFMPTTTSLGNSRVINDLDLDRDIKELQNKDTYRAVQAESDILGSTEELTKASTKLAAAEAAFSRINSLSGTPAFANQLPEAKRTLEKAKKNMAELLIARGADKNMSYKQ